MLCGRLGLFVFGREREILASQRQHTAFFSDHQTYILMLCIVSVQRVVNAALQISNRKGGSKSNRDFPLFVRLQTVVNKNTNMVNEEYCEMAPR
jgi:hypothetical protein